MLRMAAKSSWYGAHPSGPADDPSSNLEEIVAFQHDVVSKVPREVDDGACKRTCLVQKDEGKETCLVLLVFFNGACFCIFFSLKFLWNWPSGSRICHSSKSTIQQ